MLGYPNPVRGGWYLLGERNPVLARFDGTEPGGNMAFIGEDGCYRSLPPAEVVLKPGINPKDRRDSFWKMLWRVLWQLL